MVQSKNKKPPSRIEREWIAMLAEQDCVVCGAAGPCEVHEFEQGAWCSAVPLCPACHRGPQGWHGTRDRWTLNHVTQVKAINRAVRRNFELLKGAR